MNLKSKFCVWSIWICLLSCTNNNITKEVKQLMSEPIDLCDKQLAVYLHGVKINDKKTYRKEYTQVVFVDSATCSQCFWKQMPRWQSFVDSVNIHNIDISFAFVFHVKNRNRDSFIESMRQDTSFHCPVYLDTTGVFLKSNSNIPPNKLLHTFLLDKYSQVILVGNPVQNRKIRILLEDILSRKKK